MLEVSNNVEKNNWRVKNRTSLEVTGYPPPDARWRRHGAAQCARPGLKRSRCWAGGPAPRHSGPPCWPQQCAAASASSCHGHWRPPSVSEAPGRPPASTDHVWLGWCNLWWEKDCDSAACTSLQDATARCRGVSHLLSLAFTRAPREHTLVLI